MNGWLMLSAAIALEIAATSLLKASNAFARPLPGIASIVLYALCFAVMAFAMQKIPMGVAYAVWSGVGIVAIAVIGWVVFKQTISLVQGLCMGLIVVGAVGLNLSSQAG